MLILVYTSLALIVFWPFTLVTVCRRVSALRVKYHYWACLSGTKMCVRQRQAVICQSGGWLVDAASKRGPFDASRRVRVVDAGRGVGGLGTLSMWICPFPCFGCLECVARDCWPACFYPFPCTAAASSAPLRSCTALWYLWVFFLSFFAKNRAFDTRRSYSFSFALRRASAGPFISIWPRRSAVFYAASCRFQFAAATYHVKPPHSATRLV